MLADPPIYSEVWTIDETQKTEWEDFLAGNGISPEYLESVLSKYQVAQVQFGSVRPLLVWENEAVQVYVSEPRVRDHLLVVSKQPAKNFGELSEPAYLEMRKVVSAIQTILREQLQKSSCIFQWNQPQTAYFSDRFVIEVIPPRPESANVFNEEDKMDCNQYFFWRGAFPRALPNPTSQEIEQMRDFWSTALQVFPFAFSHNLLDEPFYHPSTEVIREAEAIDLLRGAIFQLLEARFSIRRELGEELIQPPPRTLSGKEQCTFCSQEILQAESVYESDLFYVLYNYKPSSSLHFLLLPKRHVRSSDGLREDEVKELYELLRILIAVVQEKTNRSDILIYTQDDPSVAQKVPHNHTHLILTPSSQLQFFLFQINYVHEPTLTREEMRPILEEFRERIRDFKERETLNQRHQLCNLRCSNGG